MGKEYIIRRDKLGTTRVFFGILCIGCGTVPIVYGKYELEACYFVGSTILFGLLLLFISSGLSIDIEQKRIRRFISFFWYRFGSWHEVKDYKCLLITKGVESISDESDSTTIVYKVSLLPINKEKLPSFLLTTFYTPTEAIEEGEKIGEMIKLPVKINNLD